MSEFEFHPQATKYDPVNALNLGKAAALAYKDEERVLAELSAWGFEKSHFLNQGGTQGYVAATAEMILVGFRGTEATRKEDLKADAKIRMESGPVGKVHRGFQDALGFVWEECLGKIREYQDQGQTLWVTGHSLGAALATMAVARLTFEEKMKVSGLYTFGSPRVGDPTFAREFNAAVGERTFRFRNNNDVVTRVPVAGFFWLRYRHVGMTRYFDVKGRLRPKISWWRMLVDRIRGRLRDLGDPGTDGLKDHRMKDGYLAALQDAVMAA